MSLNDQRDAKKRAAGSVRPHVDCRYVDRLQALIANAAAGQSRVAGVSCGIMAAILFGGGAVVSRYLVTSNAGPADLVAIRYLGAFPVALLAVALWPARLRLRIESKRLFVLLLLAGPPYHILLLNAYGGATSGAGALLIGGLVPALTLGLQRTSGDARLTACALSGLALAIVGLALLAVTAQATLTPRSAALFAVAALLWASLNVLVAQWRIDPLRLTAALALWSPVFLPFYLLSAPQPGAVTGGSLVLQLGYHGVLVAGCATTLLFACARLAGPQAASSSVALIPLAATTLGCLTLGEPFGWPQVLSLGLVTVGMLLASARSS